MHMADALVSPAVGAVMYTASAAGLGYAGYKMKKSSESEKVLPLMAVAGAFVFAAQMINFTIPGTGSSGHIGGGILLAGLLGGGPALLAIAAVLMIQCLFFADGGLLALGANIFNMGVIPCLIVYPVIFRPLMKLAGKPGSETLQGGESLSFRKGPMAAAVILSTVAGLQLGAFGVVLETLASGITELPFTAFVVLMQPVHLAIGLAEGVITAAVFIYVNSIRPEILRAALAGGSEERPGGFSVKKVVCVLAVLALLTGGGLSLVASQYPDGLEWSIEKVTGSTELEASDQVHDAARAVQERTAILPDYDFKDGEGRGTSLSGIAGAAMTCILAAVAGGSVMLLKKRRSGDRETKH